MSLWMPAKSQSDTSEARATSTPGCQLMVASASISIDSTCGWMRVWSSSIARLKPIQQAARPSRGNTASSPHAPSSGQPRLHCRKSATGSSGGKSRTCQSGQVSSTVVARQTESRPRNIADSRRYLAVGFGISTIAALMNKILVILISPNTDNRALTQLKPVRCRQLPEASRSDSVRCILDRCNARWCNGSTRDFGSLCLGSNPSRVALVFRGGRAGGDG